MTYAQLTMALVLQLVAAWFVVALLVVLLKWASRKLSAKVSCASVSGLIAMMFFCSVTVHVCANKPQTNDTDGVDAPCYGLLFGGATGGLGLLQPMPAIAELQDLQILNYDPFPAWTNAVTNVCVTGFQHWPTSVCLRAHIPAAQVGTVHEVEIYARPRLDYGWWSGIGRAHVPRYSDNVVVELPHSVLPQGWTNSMFVIVGTDVDSDGESLSDAFEVFVTGTDPESEDSDRDGLDDWTEVFETFSDPNDAYSLSGTCNDGVVYFLDGFSPLEPIGGGYTALETLFYSGSVYGHVAALPESTGSSAVLEVSAVGTGAGDLIVNGTVVPLVPGVSPLKVSVPRGVELSVELRGGPGVRAHLDSSDFCIGEWSDDHGPGVGWIAFPFVEPNHPCIHDSRTNTVEVSLDPGYGIEGLTCTWYAGSSLLSVGYGPDSVTVVNHPPLSATITAGFPRDGSCVIRYTLYHDRYLFGTATYTQSCEFCPKVEPEDESDGHGGFYDPTRDYPDDPSDDPERESDERYRYCYDHRCWYSECANLHGQPSDAYDELDPTPEYVESCSNAYARAVCATDRFTDVLKLHRPARSEDVRFIDIEVPPDGNHCCGCPEHWEGFVSLLAKSYRVTVRRGAETSGFSRTADDCTLTVRGVSPSASFEDAAVSFCKTGTVYEAHAYTVFGVSVLAEDDDGLLAALNASDATFGLPVLVNTNLERAVGLRFRTDVNLPTGNVRLAIEDAETRMQLWMWTRSTETGPGRYVKVVDSETRPCVCMSITDWKNYVRHATIERETTMFLTVFGKGKGRIVFGYAGGSGGRYLSDEVSQVITAVPVPLLPDYNRDGVIDDDDEAFAMDGAVFRYWTNEDSDKGDYIGQYTDVRPNVEPDALLANVKGKLDLVNLFPMRIDVRQIARAFGNDAQIEVIAGSGKFRYCVLDLSPSDAGDIYRDDVSTLDNEHLESASLREFRDVETGLSALGCENFRTVQRLLAMEAIAAVGDYGSPEIAVWVNGHLVMNYRMKCSIDSVREMYRWINSRHLSGGSETRISDIGVPRNNPDVVGAVKRLVFLHGADVSEDDAGKWGDQLFKRLWLSGADVDFYNVDWRSDMGLTGANYQQNASNAFEVASRVVSTIAAIPDPKVIMAHSLGNMVVSSMIQDHGLSVSKYLMCNSAVPAEAYDASLSLRVPQLVHPEWEDYPTNTWTASYHSLFDELPTDDRRLLGWPGRFADVARYAVNFYSTGDEVLELSVDNDIGVLTGVITSFGQYSWHKQELFKGRAVLGTEHWGATQWSGWGFQKKLIPTMTFPVQVRKYTVEQAADLSLEQLRADPVFDPYPLNITNSVMPLLVRAAHLTQGVPALTPPTGSTRLGNVLGDNRYFDENVNNGEDGIIKPHNWPARSSYGMRWLHSDMKDVAFWYNYRLYDKFIEVGGLK